MAAEPKDLRINGEVAVDPLSDPEERRVLFAALDSFRQYRQAAHYNITHLRRQAFYSLPSADVDILCEPPFSIPETFDAVDKAIDANADVAESMLNVGLASFGIDPGDKSWKGEATPNDIDKARSTIRQLYRDWSPDGAEERNASYSKILNALTEYLPLVQANPRHSQRVLVPGAGLGRLVYEICLAGYIVEGNEISYHQLIASNYMLNYTSIKHQHDLYPWALSFSNQLSRTNQLRSVPIPDVHPATALEITPTSSQSLVHYSERMSMAAGDFCVLYRQPEYKNSFDAVTTCFFIDTAPNFINYIRTIAHCLKPDGIWVNCGPLLWHFESTPTPAERERQRQGLNASSTNSDIRKSRNSSNKGIGERGSFELSNDEVLALIQKFGFQIVEQRNDVAGMTGYIQDSKSMLQNVYQSSFWVARRA